MPLGMTAMLKLRGALDGCGRRIGRGRRGSRRAGVVAPGKRGQKQTVTNENSFFHGDNLATNHAQAETSKARFC